MVYRKGELNAKRIDAEWPHQVALRAEATLGARYVSARLFCEALSLAPRGHTFIRDDTYFNVWCFAVQADAEAFQAKFGGEFIAPKERPRWPGR